VIKTQDTVYKLKYTIKTIVTQKQQTSIKREKQAKCQKAEQSK